MKNSAHAGANGGGIERITFIGEGNDSADAGRLGRAENGAEVAGGAQVLDDQPAEAVMGIAMVQRPPVLSDDSADAGGFGGDGDATELFGRDAGLMNAAGG